MNINQSPKNTFIITAASIVVGVCYFTYISSVSFPHSAARIIPFAWLIGAVWGFKSGLTGLRSMQGYVRLLFFTIALLNILFASIFSLGALMGD